MSQKQIHPYAQLKITIVEATWIKDADFFGKQDPFIKFTYDGKEMKTTTKDEAGKHAVFNEEFYLRNIDAVVQSGQLFKLESFDEDAPGKFESIGFTKEIPYQDFTNQRHESYTVDMFDSNGKVCGSITFKTHFATPGNYDGNEKVTASFEKSTVQNSQQQNDSAQEDLVKQKHQDDSSFRLSTQYHNLSSTATVDRLRGSCETPFENVNWTETVLFKKYENKESTEFAVSDDHFQFEDIVNSLALFKKDPNGYRSKEQVEPFYQKSLKALELVMAETQPNDEKFQKIKEMYKEVSFENTIKLMIRCKMNFDTRRSALELFELVETYRSQYLDLQDAVIKASGNEDILKAKEIFCDPEKLNEIRNVSRVIKSSAKAVLKKANEIQKREEKGEKSGGYTVLYENEDLNERVLTQVSHIKQLLDKCKKIEINDDLKNIQQSQDSHSADREAKQVQFEHQDDSAEVRRQSTKSNRKSVNSKKRKGSTGSGRGSTMSNKSKGSFRHQMLEPYANVPDLPPNINGNDAFQPRANKQYHQMFKTAHEGGFYKGPETERSMSKKKRKVGKSKRNKNQSYSTISKSKGNQYTQNSHTPVSSGISTEVGFNQKPNSQLYGVKNLTMMKNPMQFAKTGQNFFNHEKLSDSGMNLKQAMNRKLHLPNAMPRRQEMIYDLNGRPIYRSSHRTAELTNVSRSPKNCIRTEDFIGLQAHSSFITQQDKSKIQLNEHKKKASPLGLRTDYTKVQAHIFDKKRGSHMVPKQSNPYYNIKRDPVKVLNTQLSQVSKMNVMREASQKSMSPPQSKMQNLPQISQAQKLPRPEAASEKAHIFNPRARSTIRQQPIPSSYDSAGVGLNPISMPPLGAQNIQINKMTLNKSSQPEMNTDIDIIGPQSERDVKAKNLSRKLSPIQQKLNTERAMNSTQQMAFGHRRGSQETSFGNIRQGQHDTEDSKMDLAFVSQKQHKWQSPKRQSGLSTNEQLESAMAVNSLYTENVRVDHFTSQFSSVWLRGKEGMYQDNSIGSDIKRQRREAQSMLFNMERQQKKMEKMQERAAKDALCQHYLENYGILPSSQQKFFLDPERLRLLLIKMATAATQRAAAMRIQHWMRGRLQRQKFIRQLKATIKATKYLQSFFKRYTWTVILPRKLKKQQENHAWLIQRVMKGYHARRKMLKERYVQQINAHNDYWHRYKIVLQTSFQRRMRRVWLAYKFRKAEKKRKAAERAAASKGKKKKKTAKPAQPPAEPSAVTSQSTLAQTMKPPTLNSQISTGPNPLNQTMTDLQKSESQIFDDQNATKTPNDDVTMMDGDVVNINVSQSNNDENLNQTQTQGEGLTTINEEEAPQTNEKQDDGEGEGDDMDRAEAPKVEVGELAEGDGEDGEGEKPE